MTPIRWRAAPTPRNERGIALVLAVLVLLSLTGVVVSYLAVSALEPQISRNLADTARARYLAEAGLEQGFNVLVHTADGAGSWTGLLAGATPRRPWVAVAGLTDAALAGAGEAGVFSVTLRNDRGAADTLVTGLTSATSPALDTTPDRDENRLVIMRSTGTFRGASKTIEAVVRGVALPPLPGAVNVQGRRLEASVTAAGLDLDGRDYGCTLPGNQCDLPSNWTVDAANPTKDGVAVVTPTIVDDFVARVASHPAARVLESTPACPMVVTGSAAGPTSLAMLSNGCGLDTAVNLGTRADPRLVVFRGNVDTAAGVKGAGILVVQGGDITNHGTLEWDGLVLVAGRNASLAFADASHTTIRGASGGVDVRVGGGVGSLSIRSSQQNLDMAQRMRPLHVMTNWREI